MRRPSCASWNLLIGCWGCNYIDRAKKLAAAESENAPAEIQKLANERVAAKTARDWARADALRDQIDAAGWRVEDTKDGIKVIRK